MEAAVIFGLVLLLGLAVWGVAWLVRTNPEREAKMRQAEAASAAARLAPIEEAKAAYAKALAELRSNPGDPALREAALAWGRHYAAKTRGGGVALFDEVALANDLNAAGAGTAAPRPSEPTRRCPACAEEILADAKKCKHCGEWIVRAETT